MKPLLALALLLAGCREPMTNDAVVKEHKKCLEAGMRTNILMDGWTNQTVAVQCVPQEPRGSR